MTKSEYMKQWRLKNKDRVKQHQAKYYENHKQSIAEKGKIYREENKEALQLKNKKYSAEHKEDAKKRAIAWDATHPEEVKARTKRYADKNREIVRERQRLCKKNNPENGKFHVAKRRVAIRQATVPWINEFFVKEAYKLVKLREKLTGIKWSVDHIIPLQGKNVSGLHVHNNLQVIPFMENVIKNNHYSLGENR
jgi:hypothetical protein